MKRTRAAMLNFSSSCRTALPRLAPQKVMDCCAGCCAQVALYPLIAGLTHVLGEDNTLSAAARDCGKLLTSLHTDVLRQLHGESLDFQLLLPEDDTPLALRAGELACWCQGFLYGLGLGGLRGDVDLPATVNEVMHDFYEIANTRFDYESENEADEEAYMEIVEYVRMSVLLLHDELQPAPVTARLQ